MEDRISAIPATEASTAEDQLLVTLERKPSWEIPRAGSSARRYGGGDYEISSRTRHVVEKLGRRYGMRRIDGWPIGVLDIHCVVYAVPPEADRDELMERLDRDPEVESVQPMNLFEVLGRKNRGGRPEPARFPEYDDPYLELQHGIVSMQVEQAHRLAQGRGVEVAVVDTGVDVSHPDLAGRVLRAEDFVGDATPFRQESHGTAVGGIIASVADNGIGIVGIAPNVRILALRACWERPEGAVCNSFTLAKALAFVIDEDPDILNLSLAGPSDPLLERLLRTATARGIVVVAARDDGHPVRTRFPTTVESVLTVGAAESRSGTGRSETTAGNPGLLAPGTDLITTMPGGRYDFVSGNSFAAAEVAGIVALLLERNPDLDTEDLLALLRETSLETEAPGGPIRMVNACAALARLLRTEPCSRSSPPRKALSETE